MKAKRSKPTDQSNGKHLLHPLNIKMPLWAWARMEQERARFAEIYGTFSMGDLLIQHYCANLPPAPEEGKTIPSPIGITKKRTAGK